MRVRVRDVRTGELVVDAAAFTGSKSWPDFHDSEVGDLALRADGLVAWSAPVPPRDQEGPSPSVSEVRWAHPRLPRARPCPAWTSRR